MISFEPLLSSLHSCIKFPETEVRLFTALASSLAHSLRSSDPRSIRQDLHKSAEKLPVVVGRAGQTVMGVFSWSQWRLESRDSLEWRHMVGGVDGVDTGWEGGFCRRWQPQERLENCLERDGQLGSHKTERWMPATLPLWHTSLGLWLQLQTDPVAFVFCVFLSFPSRNSWIRSLCSLLCFLSP